MALTGELRVELVEDDGGVRQAVGSALDEGWAHVDADFADGGRIAAVRRQIIGKCLDLLGIFALRR